MAPVGPRKAGEIAELIARVRQLHRPGDRVLIGITGEPGAGKTTLAQALTRHFPGKSALAPMDGFHLAQQELERLHRADRKGAADTFDSWGFLALLRRLKAREEPVVYAPIFNRALEEPVGSALPIDRDVEIIFTEGNYLLLDTDGWREVAGLLDEIWYIEIPTQERVRRLIARHRAYGKTPKEAAVWARGSDERNAAVVRSQMQRADLIFRSR